MHGKDGVRERYNMEEVRIVSDQGTADANRILDAIKPDLVRVPSVQDARFCGENAPLGAMGNREITAGAVLLAVATVAFDHALGEALYWLKDRFCLPGAPAAVCLEISRPDGGKISIEDPAALTPEQIEAYVKALTAQPE